MNIKRPQSAQPLPQNAKKVFSGIIFDVYQWEQKQFDGTIKTFEKLKRPDTVVVIPVIGDKIVMLEQEQPGRKTFYSFASGRVEKGEEIDKAAERELLEETGLKAQNLILFDAIQPQTKIDWVVFTFIGKHCTYLNTPTPDSGESIKLKEITFDEMVEIMVDNQFYDRETALKFTIAKLKDPLLKDLKNLFFS
jgi:ADP-ribose pyrophosphatase